MELDFANDTIEKLLLKRAFTDKHWINILSKTYDKRWFKVKNVGSLLKLILRYYEKYSKLPTMPIVKELAKKFESTHQGTFNMPEVNELLAEINRLDINIPEEILKKNFEEFMKRNAFFNSLWDNATLLEKSEENYEKVVDKCLANFERVQKLIFVDTDLGLNYFDENSMKDHWDYINNPEAKIETGWKSLDQYTNGGFLKNGKMLGLFMAQAGLGKSVFLSNLAVNMLKKNLSIVVLSLEMSQDVYAQRFDAHISGQNINRLNVDSEQAIQRIKHFYELHPESNLYIKEYPPRSISTRDIEQYLENLVNAGKKIDAIIVDYLNLVIPNTRTDSMFKDGLAVSEELRALSYKFNAPVISAVQCNTEGMGSADIDMQNISESRGIAHSADFIAALYQVDNDRDNGIINLKIVKNRLGGMVGKHSRFSMNSENLTLTDVTFDASFDPADNQNTEVGKITSSLNNNLSSDILNLQ